MHRRTGDNEDSDGGLRKARARQTFVHVRLAAWGGDTVAAPPASAQSACDVLTNLSISEGAHVSRVGAGDNRKQTG